jgi:hypothetical protein
MKHQFIIRPWDRVLILEDDHERIVWFRSRVPHALIVRNPLIAIEALRARPFDLVLIDEDVPCPQHFSGTDVAKFLARNGYRGGVLIHSHNQRAVREMKRIFQDAMVYEFGDFEIFTRRNHGL